MKKKFLSLIIALCLFMPCIFLFGCMGEKDPTDDDPSQNVENPIEPANVVNVLLSEDGKTLYRFAPDNDETEYVVPSGVKTIAESAFENCNTLTKVTFPESLQFIKEEAFKNCGNLTTVEINSDIRIGAEAFYSCQKLSNIDISKITSFNNETSSYYSEGANYAFYDCDALTSVTIAKEVKYLPKGIFSYTNSLTTITFEEDSKLYSILEEAFAYSGITTISVPSSCIGFDTGAFKCSQLKNITIGKNICLIAPSAFYDCEDLESVDFETGRTERLTFQYSGNDYFAHTFAECSNLKSVTNYPAESGVLGYMFSNCKKLESFTFADEECGGNGEKVGECAFYNCEQLKEIHVPKYLHTIDKKAFSDCKSLEKITFANLGWVKSEAFGNCISLKELDLDASIIDYRAFYNCYSLHSLRLQKKYRFG